MEYVIKRDGTKVPFDKSKVVNAIEKAMTNTTGGVDSRVSNAIADYIADIPDTMSVEQIQDVVIGQLKNSPLSDVADAYSHWRILRQEIREKQRAYPSVVGAHFKGTDSEESPGLTSGISYKELEESMK